MPSDLIVSIMNNVVVLIVAAGGWLMAWRLHNDKKQQTRNEAWAKKLESDLEWRIKHEQVSADYVAELAGVTADKAKRDIRNRMKAYFEVPPQITDSQLKRRSSHNQAMTR